MSINVPGGKGSAARPFGVDMQTFDTNFERIFGKKEKKEDIPGGYAQQEQNKDNE